MAEPDEVPDDLKEPDHLLPYEDWKQVKADAAKYAAEDTDDIDVPDDVDDEPVEEWPDEVSRGETLRGDRL